jgi:hypothetical protein
VGGESSPEGGSEPARGRSAAKDAAVRASLTPLRPGERPRAVTVAAVLALALALINAGAYLAGSQIAGQRPQLVAVAAPVLLLLLLAWGMWRARYWAVLTMQVLLAVLITLFAVLGVFAENARSALLALAVVSGAGTLFWFLVKAMARIQMPGRDG